MKRILPALALCCALLLSGCTSLLERTYTSVEPHTEHTVSGSDTSTIKADTYSELVNAILFFVSQGMEEGVVQLTGYEGDVEADLNQACLEVAKDDPLGAYAVDFIKNDYTRVLTTYEATITISYRRTQEQINSLVNVTGSSAIREEVGQALAAFQPELALRVGYFTEEMADLDSLIRQAYYDDPASALGMPLWEINLYPDTGNQRIVEILLIYPESAELLAHKKEDLLSTVEQMVLPLHPSQHTSAERLSLLFQLLPDAVHTSGTGSTAWDAILGDGADSEGLALAFQLLCDEMDIGSTLIEGTLNGQPHFWNQLTDNGGTHYVDLTRSTDGTTWSAEDLIALGYVWAGSEEIE
ncbi:hypothetical protein [Flavonifractor hominis]|uniref:GerMN domain-containing protein n=1 Tax=Flavonifractor hominis TaxID=3133178 RepID=A0ABV1EPA9_9FIRM